VDALLIEAHKENKDVSIGTKPIIKLRFDTNAEAKSNLLEILKSKASIEDLNKLM